MALPFGGLLLGDTIKYSEFDSPMPKKRLFPFRQHTGLFLHDFFGRRPPRYRHVGLPVLSKNPWIKITENIA